MTLSEKKIYPRWKATVRGGRLYYEDEGRFSTHLIPYEGKTLSVVVKNWTKDRSRQEEKFYHAVVVRLVAEAMSITDQEAHEFLKKMWLTVEESFRRKDGTRVGYKRVMSTTELSDGAYRMYWEQCIRWAALPTKASGLGPDSGLELVIPYPKEVDYSNY